MCEQPSGQVPWTLDWAAASPSPLWRTEISETVSPSQPLFPYIMSAWRFGRSNTDLPASARMSIWDTQTFMAVSLDFSLALKDGNWTKLEWNWSTPGLADTNTTRGLPGEPRVLTLYWQGWHEKAGVSCPSSQWWRKPTARASVSPLLSHVSTHWGKQAFLRGPSQPESA